MYRIGGGSVEVCYAGLTKVSLISAYSESS
jgi:hypothetical protein